MAIRLDAYFLFGLIYYAMSMVAAKAIRILETHMRPAYLRI